MAGKRENQAGEMEQASELLIPGSIAATAGLLRWLNSAAYAWSVRRSSCSLFFR